MLGTLLIFICSVLEQWTDSDKAFSAIFTGCVANRENCALGKGNNKTAAELEQAVWNMLDTVKYHPIPLGSFIVDYSALKTLIVNAIYSSALWPGLATMLNDLLTGNLNELAQLIEAISPSTTPTVFEQLATQQALLGIQCGDNMVRTDTFADFVPYTERLAETSRLRK